ncbi:MULTISPECIES: AglZ/HisF2 family acetamidino modification protein [unclassified Erythrobacter]|uniref:AglZ/HisF2 family acetamidino modification protein n=1 Tax=unclassified Erythrobacter TaxID=2633097 RepID=UPI00076DED3D|nr:MULTISPECIES: AglZ/HisF2 family acetamidino modification protein [unclassified Erythrobacter]KWV96290.1 imidazole glycerol phosphate synthase cyclase subunit [Erythrobacter sp. AP23]MBO6768978.1 imidazole glycerol phosphate synthase subunit HisF [Erythrobacter sp.]
MLRPRLIPCLLVHNSGLVKTVKFDDPKYVGDPINAVRIFNEKSVDELMVIDIDATRLGNEPNYRMIENLANESRMPLSYGGGVNSVEQVERIIGLGVEKVAISAAAVSNPDLIRKAAERVGAQSVVVVLDIQRTGLFRRPEIVTHNATKRTGLEPGKFLNEISQQGAGEIVLNFVDLDGTLKGYDLDLIDRVRQNCSLPMTVLGGAGSLQDIEQLWNSQGLIGAAAGSLFVFKGRYRAVLINYPNPEEKVALLRQVQPL